ncbi:MAG: hypothetical protein ACRCTQ_03985 [Brevinemataceae bacterium]
MEDESFLNAIQGTYSISLQFANCLNLSDHYFIVSPSPVFSTQMMFVVPSSGTIGINNGNNTTHLVLQFCYTIPNQTKDSIYQVYQPSISSSGSFISQNRFFKVQRDVLTNLYLSLPASSSQIAETLSADMLFGNRFSSEN